MNEKRPTPETDPQPLSDQAPEEKPVEKPAEAEPASEPAAPDDDEIFIVEEDQILSPPPETDPAAPGDAPSDPAAAGPAAPTAPAAQEADDPGAALTAALADAAPTPTPGPRVPRPPGRRRKKGLQDIKPVAAPILGTVGAMLMVPAIWAVMILQEYEIWASDRSDAVLMAKVMLICWPIALILLASAAVFFWQTLTASRRAKGTPDGI